MSLLAVNFQEIFLIHSHWHFQRLLAGEVRSLGHLCCHILPLWKVLGKGDIFLSHCQKRSLFLPIFLWCILFNITNRLLNWEALPSFTQVTYFYHCHFEPEQIKSNVYCRVIWPWCDGWLNPFIEDKRQMLISVGVLLWKSGFSRRHKETSQAFG